MPISYRVVPAGALAGHVCVPGDKSISHRCMILAAIAHGTTTIKNFLFSDDCAATMSALQALGVNMTRDATGKLIVEGVGKKGLCSHGGILDFGNAGTGLRLMTGLLAGHGLGAILTGDHSLAKRPMARIIAPLTQMGADIQATVNDNPPLIITADQPLHGITYLLPIASAQVKSAVLLAGLYAEGTTTVIQAKPTRDHTERLLQMFGYPVSLDGQSISLSSHGQLQAISMTVPGDFSSAAFFIVSALITKGSHILLENVGVNPTRIGMVTILRLMGANIIFLRQRYHGAEPVADIIVGCSSLNGIEIPEKEIALAIDEFPIIFIAAACATGSTVLHHAQELRVKESDRIAVMVQGLKSLGIEVQEYPDGLSIKGGKFQSGEVDSHGDHRVAMAFTIAGHVATGPVTITDCDNIATSFPNFLPLAQQLGLHISAC